MKRRGGFERGGWALPGLDLVDSRTTATGVTIQVYRPLGRPRYAPSTEETS